MGEIYLGKQGGGTASIRIRKHVTVFEKGRILTSTFMGFLENVFSYDRRQPQK